MLSFSDFCPALDQDDLLRFRDDAYYAWMEAPQHQRGAWRLEYLLICDLVETSRSGQIRLG